MSNLSGIFGDKKDNDTKTSNLSGIFGNNEESNSVNNEGTNLSGIFGNGDRTRLERSF